jgi:hypothetical protein
VKQEWLIKIKTKWFKEEMKMIKSVSVFDSEILKAGSKVNCKCKVNKDDVEFILDIDATITNIKNNRIDCEAIDGIGYKGCKNFEIYLNDVLSGMAILKV